MIRLAITALIAFTSYAQADYYSSKAYICRDLTGLVTVEYNATESNDARMRYGMLGFVLRNASIIQGSSSDLPSAYTQDRVTGAFVELTFMPGELKEGKNTLNGVITVPSFFALPNLLSFGPFQTPPPGLGMVIPMRSGAMVLAYVTCVGEFKNHDKKQTCSLKE